MYIVLEIKCMIRPDKFSQQARYGTTMSVFQIDFYILKIKIKIRLLTQSITIKGVQSPLQGNRVKDCKGPPSKFFLRISTCNM